MDRLIASNSVPLAQADTAPSSGTPQYATDGNPATNVPATLWPAYAFNALQDEIYNVIISAGLTPNRNAWNQLLTALQMMLQGSTTNVGVDTGAANAYVVAFTPALTAPVPWVPFWFEVKTTNTGASTLNATGTVEPLVGGAHLALQGGELVAKGNALVYWNPTLASGTGSYVLLFCSGAPEQIAPATQSEHAMAFGQATGRLLNIQVITSSGTYTPSSSLVTSVEVEVQGAGGGSAGCAATGAGQVSVGSGGGAGAYARSRLTSGFSGATVTVGAAGAAGAAGGNGGNGGSSAFGSVTAGGGFGGGGAGPTSTSVFAGATSVATASGGNILNISGNFPAYSWVSIIGSTPLGIPAGGGVSQLGSTSGPGSAGKGYGAGGGGTANNPSTAAAPGFAGTQGVVIVREYA